MSDKPYDSREGRFVQDADLPEGITARHLKRYCHVHGVRFYSLDIIGAETLDGSAAAWRRDPLAFRVATQEMPSRGLNVLYAGVVKWIGEMQKVDLVEARSLCAELPVIEDRLRRAGLFATAVAMNTARKDIMTPAYGMGANRTRAEASEILARETIARRTGKWGPWHVLDTPEGAGVGRGWAADVRRVYRNHLYVVLSRPFIAASGETMLHLAIRTPSSAEPPWRDLQRIKNELCGETCHAVQVHPRQDRLIDEADMYHLWVHAAGYEPGYGLHPEDRRP